LVLARNAANESSQAGGTIETKGGQPLQIDGTFNWIAGVWQGDRGGFVVNGKLNIKGASAKKISNTQVTNNGVVEWTGGTISLAIAAVEQAALACRQTNWERPHYLNVLAAACAQQGDFKEAIKWQRYVIESGLLDKRQAESAEWRLKLYESGVPYHDERK
jgi:hypothetical protein